jgi:hypothetical protein
MAVIKEHQFPQALAEYGKAFFFDRFGPINASGGRMDRPASIRQQVAGPRKVRLIRYGNAWKAAFDQYWRRMGRLIEPLEQESFQKRRLTPLITAVAIETDCISGKYPRLKLRCLRRSPEQFT